MRNIWMSMLMFIIILSSTLIPESINFSRREKLNAVTEDSMMKEDKSEVDENGEFIHDYDDLDENLVSDTEFFLEEKMNSDGYDNYIDNNEAENDLITGKNYFPETKIIDEQRKIETNNLEVNNIENFPLYSGIDSYGVLENREIWKRNTVMLNEMVDGKIYVNNEELLFGVDRVIKNGDTVRVDNIGTDRDGNRINSEWSFSLPINDSERLRISNNDGFPIIQGFGSMNYEVKHYYDDGNLVLYPLWLSFSLTVMPRISILQNDLHGIVTSDYMEYSENDDHYFFGSRFVGDIYSQPNFNLIVEPSFSGRFENLANSTIELYQQQGINLGINWDPPEVKGLTTDEEFVSRYSISQEIPTFVDDKFIMSVDVPEILVPQVYSVHTEDGTDITNLCIIDVGRQIVVTIPEKSIHDFAGGKVTVSLEYLIDKDNSPQDFLQDDGYLKIPLKSSIMDSEDVVTGMALTWARPWGEAVGTTLYEGITTEQLNPEDFVKNLDNKLIEDEPFVVGFLEEKKFDSLGDDTLSVIIESKVSRVQNIIAVPIIVSVIPPVDPLDPGTEVNPENKPDIPINQGLFSIDFVSQFNFGEQAISVQDQTYYAKPQRLLNGEGTLLENEERPNYIQISDRRKLEDRTGWELILRQEKQFLNGTEELKGAQIRLKNAELVTAQSGIIPNFISREEAIIPGKSHVLLGASGEEGIGTWVYRFGNYINASESVSLEIPQGTNPKAIHYSTTLDWELNMTPENVN